MVRETDRHQECKGHCHTAGSFKYANSIGTAEDYGNGNTPNHTAGSLLDLHSSSKSVSLSPSPKFQERT